MDEVNLTKLTCKYCSTSACLPSGDDPDGGQFKLASVHFGSKTELLRLFTGLSKTFVASDGE